MLFEYHSFEVESYLKQGSQPVFMFSDVNKSAKYYTLIDPVSGGSTLTTGMSDAVRIPIFALSTVAAGVDTDLKKLTHGSLLTGLGLETAIRFMGNLGGVVIERVLVVLATNCHELPNCRYRAYLGISAESRG